MSVADAGSDAGAPTASRRAPTWPRVALVGALFVLAFVVAKSCQQSQIKVTEAEAVATAKEQVDFAPENTQVRLLRQGLDRRPFWVVSLSIPSGEGTDSYSELALVRIDATTGDIESVQVQNPEQGGQAGQRTGGSQQNP
jgi:hypothetical protein